MKEFLQQYSDKTLLFKCLINDYLYFLIIYLLFLITNVKISAITLHPHSGKKRIKFSN